MKAFAIVILLAASAKAQTDPTPVVPQIAAVSGTAMTIDQAAAILASAQEIIGPQAAAALQNTAQVVLAAANAPKLAAGPWSGKFDFTSWPYPSVYQSFTSLDQAVGFEKHVWSLYKGNVELFRMGAFGGLYKPMLTEPRQSPRSLGGVTAQVPGSALDWALGTHWGAEFVPALKSSVIIAADLTRFNDIGWRNTFYGVGLSYYH